MNLNSRSKLNQIAYLLLVILMADCAVFGGGSFFRIGGIDYRMVLFAGFFFLSLPAVFRDFKKLCCNSYLIGLMLWALWLFISAIHGYRAGNSSAHIQMELTGFAAFAMLPGTICLLSHRDRILTLMKVLAAAAFALSLQTFAILLIYCFDQDLLVQLNLWMISAELGGCTGVNDTLVRIFLRSHPCMVLGCICSFYLAYRENRRGIRILHCVNIAFGMMALILSYTRSLYLGVVAGAGLMLILSLVLYWKSAPVKKALIQVTAAVLVCFAALLLVFDLTGHTRYLTYGLYRSTNLSVFNPDGIFTDDSSDPDSPEHPGDINDLSDNIRAQTKAELYEKIGQHPFAGSGLGAILECRAPLDGGNEYFYLGLAFSSGLIGLILFLIPILLLIFFLIRGFRRISPEDSSLCITWFAGFASIALFSVFNPYLTGINGISIYCCTIAVFSALNGQQQLSKTI